MNTAIVYESKSGNTKLLAQAIHEVIKDVVYMGGVCEIDADLYICGSWTDKGSCDEKMTAFLKTLRHKKIIWFQTAGFGGSKEYYECLFERVKQNIDESNQILGHFYCQGKMGMAVKERYLQLLEKNPDDLKLKASIENFEMALSHPDRQDLTNIQTWILNLMGE